ncbi:hypothetical protein [Thiocapsa roseopersicina]|uniref:Carboxypeptidase regulatory-like domain-containing protein n=1 Tax=Thiocapsa roseopersicina TaxID=1058 RepID=A0A1H2WAS8_THIRO|nr:hypothetical protein [Thiocapsa roseopersicina]SDW77700.1 hypothetical protein SAMN05421783_108119 [Thiocapsa roseopersicina]
MSRPAGRNRSDTASHRAPSHGGRGRRGVRWIERLLPGLALLSCVLLALLLTPSPVFAQARGVDVRAMDSRVLTVDPREVVTVVFQVTNRTGAAADLEGRLLMPEGWRAITPEFPFTLPAGGSAMRLVSFFVPERIAAGEYRVSYQVGIRGRPGALGGSTLAVRVRPVFKLQVDILELPTIAIASEPYTAVFQIVNSSNTALTVGYGAQSSRESEIEPAVGTLTLAPGESQPIEMTVRPPAVTEPAWDEISLTATAAAGEQGETLTDTAKRSVETLPRVTGKEAPPHSIKTLFTRRVGGSWSGRDDGENGAGVQLEWSGSGSVDGTQERILSFLLRWPGLEDDTIFGQDNWFYVDYRGRNFDLTLGDATYGLSPLTDPGISGRGMRFAWRGEGIELSAYHVGSFDFGDDDEDAYYQGHQTGLGLLYALRPTWILGLSYLDQTDNVNGHSQILGVRQQAALGAETALDVELAGSTGDAGDGMAFWGNLIKLGAPWRYRLTLLYASPDYAGYYQNQDRAYLDVDYAPLEKPWSLRAWYHYDRDHQTARQLAEYDQEDWWSLDPDDWDWYGPDSEEHEAGVGLNWRTADQTRYSVELRRRQRSDLNPAPTFDEVENSIRFGYGKSFKDLNLSLNTSIELGEEYDRVTGESSATQAVRASLFWRATRRLNLGGYLSVENEAAATFDEAPRFTGGASVSYAVSPKSTLSLNVQGQQYNGQNSVIADIAYRHARENGDLITVQARHGSRYAELYDNGMNMENSIMLSYMVPIEVPTVPRRDVATVRGRAFDQETGTGLSNVVLKLDRLVAITDENGYFMFPSVKLGVYDLTLAGGSLPVGMIPTLEMPRPVDLYFDAGATIDVPFIRGATIAGKVQLYEPDAALLPSQTFVRVGQGVKAPPPPTSEELKPSRGLGGILVEVRNGEQVYRRLTNGNGEFRFAGLQPGTWIVTIDPEKLPENATIEETGYTLEVEPSADQEVEFRVELKIRTMRMLGTLKVKG